MNREILAEFRILLQNTWLPRYHFKIRLLCPHGRDSSDCIFWVLTPCGVVVGH
jgi:hypothetical protein